MTRLFNGLGAALAAMVLLVSMSCSGNSIQQLNAPPYIPAAYYNCIETYPEELVHAYFAGYGEIWGPKAMYNDNVFVSRKSDRPVVVRELDKGGCGWIYSCAP